jgi:hypothetical protein
MARQVDEVSWFSRRPTEEMEEQVRYLMEEEHVYNSYSHGSK